MEERNIRRLVTLVLCIGMTVLGVYMTFFGGKQEKKSNEEGTEELYQEGRLPEVENSSTFEQYGNGAGTDIYFSNTDVIDQGIFRWRFMQSSQRRQEGIWTEAGTKMSRNCMWTMRRMWKMKHIQPLNVIWTGILQSSALPMRPGTVF